MMIKDVMSKKIVKIASSASLVEAAQLLFTHQISGLLVHDDYGNLVGVLSEKDLYRALYPSYKEFYENPAAAIDYAHNPGEMVLRAKEKKVVDVMSSKMVTVYEEDSAVKAGALMLASKINRLPVVDRNGHLVGIVSRRDIYQNLFQRELSLT